MAKTGEGDSLIIIFVFIPQVGPDRDRDSPLSESTKRSSKQSRYEGEEAEAEERMKLERHKCLWVLWNDCSIAEYISK